MPLNKSKGQMYPWVTHTHAHLGGECPHKCSYCYVDNPRFGRPERYTGPLRLIEEEFAVKYGAGKTIFIEHMNDLFCKDMPHSFIQRVIDHCIAYPENTYVFQTKNPYRYFSMFTWPKKKILGTTIETNRNISGCLAPQPEERMHKMVALFGDEVRKFVTIEPVMDFDVEILADWIIRINPAFLNLGADSKNHGLPEPTVEKIMALVRALKENGIEVREKHNIERLKQT